MVELGKQCSTCLHFRGAAPTLEPEVDRGGGPPTTRDAVLCAAFPDWPGIPGLILADARDHRVPFRGDHGVRWAPVAPGVVFPLERAPARGT